MVNMTECHMARSFIAWLPEGGAQTIAAFHKIVSELPCRQGIPDVVGVCFGRMEEISLSFIANLEPAETLVMSFLKSRAPRRFEFLRNATGLSSGRVKTATRRLEEQGFVERTISGSFRLHEEWAHLDVEIWAFELKMKDFRRALFQALQYQAFASRTVIVIPASRPLKQKETFARFGIGLYTFDPETQTLEELLRPNVVGPTSRYHWLYALRQLGRFLNSSRPTPCAGDLP